MKTTRRSILKAIVGFVAAPFMLTKSVATAASTPIWVSGSTLWSLDTRIVKDAVYCTTDEGWRKIIQTRIRSREDGVFSYISEARLGPVVAEEDLETNAQIEPYVPIICCD